MDVTCERCQTEYEFDETLLSERGTTVKCTNCGHLFKVFRAGAGETERPWIVRRADGATETLATLKDLQRRITEGQLAETDELSRSGEAWKRLGDIAELTTFFAAARAVKMPSVRPEGTQRFGTLKPGAQATPTRPPTPAGPFKVASSVPPESRARLDSQSIPAPAAVPREAPKFPSATKTVLGPPPASAPPPPAVPGTLPPAPRTPTPVPPPAAPVVPAATVTAPTELGTGEATVRDTKPRDATVDYAVDQPTTPAIRRPSAGPAPAPTFENAAATVKQEPTTTTSSGNQAAPRLRIDEDEFRSAPPPKLPGRSFGWVVWVGLIVVLGGAAAFTAPKWLPLLTGAPAAQADKRATFLAQGDVELAKDDDTSYAAAITEYTKALAFDDRDPTTLAKLATAHAVWAQALRFDAEDLDARATSDLSLAGQAQRVRTESEQHVAEAKRFADAAMTASNGHPALAVSIASADAARLSGDGERTQALLLAASGAQGALLADQARIEALHLLGAHDSGARARSEQAVEADPTSNRAHLVAARLALGAADVEAARRHLDAILASNASHTRAKALLDAIRDGKPPAPAVVALVDAGVLGGPVGPPERPDAGMGLGAGATGTAGVAGTEPANPAISNGNPADPATATGAAGGHDVAEPGHPYEWYVTRGEAALNRGAVADARRAFEAALRARANGSEALFGLGGVSENQSDFAGAAGYYQRASSAGYAPALAGLGDALFRQNDTAGAIRAYRNYLERAPNGGEADRVKRRLCNQLDVAEMCPGGGNAAQPQGQPEPQQAEPAPSAPPPSEPAERPAPPPPEAPAPPPGESAPSGSAP